MMNESLIIVLWLLVILLNLRIRRIILEREKIPPEIRRMMLRQEMERYLSRKCLKERMRNESKGVPYLLSGRSC